MMREANACLFSEPWCYESSCLSKSRQTCVRCVVQCPGVLRNVPCMLRNVLGVLRNVLGVLRNVVGVLRNVPGVLRNVSLSSNIHRQLERSMAKVHWPP